MRRNNPYDNFSILAKIAIAIIIGYCVVYGILYSVFDIDLNDYLRKH